MGVTGSGRLASLLVSSAVSAMLACSGRPDGGMPVSGTPEGGGPGQVYEKSPIVFGAYDTRGTFFVTLESGKAERINDNASFLWMQLSPSRKRVAQVTRGPKGDPALRVEVYEVVPDSGLLGSFPARGILLGWADEDTLVFGTFHSEGVTRMRIDGTDQTMPFPDWVQRDSTDPLTLTLSPNGVLSPDGKSAAFLVSIEAQPAAPNATTLLVTSTETGAVESIWAIPADQRYGRVIWAPDGRIVYYPLEKPALMTGTVGAPSLSEPVSLPFQPCFARHWVTADTLHMRHTINIDGGYCGGSWLIDTDGGNPRARNAEAPTAISPDGRKILLLAEGGKLAVADPDGGGETPIADIPRAHWPVW